MQDDWRWFSQPEHQDGTRKEVDDLRDHGIFDGRSLADGCFVHALCRVRREVPPIETLLIVWPAGLELNEDECRATWFKTDRILAGKAEGLKQ